MIEPSWTTSASRCEFEGSRCLNYVTGHLYEKKLGEILIAAKVIRLEQAAKQLLSAQPAADGQVERVRPRILIVEDHPVNMELMVALLERGGYEIYTCGDGREVMGQAKAHRPDLILLDINLPHIDGLTLARLLRDDPETSAVTIVAVSAYSVTGDEERICRAGCDGFIPKPIDTKSFLQTISTFLDRGTAR